MKAQLIVDNVNPTAYLLIKSKYINKLRKGDILYQDGDNNKIFEIQSIGGLKDFPIEIESKCFDANGSVFFMGRAV